MGLKKHEFGKLPVKIIWFQVAGLNEEHIALLKFDLPSATANTSFEEFICLGKVWDYSLYDLRLSATQAFLSQMTGKKNIKNTCEDYSLRPIWSYMLPTGYKVGVFESQADEKESVTQALKCEPKYLDNLVVWKMQKAQEGNFFHHSELTPFKPGAIYYDRSCSKGKDCFTSFSNNVISVFQNYYKNTENYLYIVRNFQLQHYLEKNDLKNIKSELDQLNKSLSYFLKLSKSESNVLVLVTAGETYNAKYPDAGKNWEQFVKATHYKLGDNSRLMSPILAAGARAENFCGIYDQSEVLNRIFSGAKQQGLEFTIINPFN